MIHTIQPKILLSPLINNNQTVSLPSKPLNQTTPPTPNPPYYPQRDSKDPDYKLVTFDNWAIKQAGRIGRFYCSTTGSPHTELMKFIEKGACFSLALSIPPFTSLIAEYRLQKGLENYIFESPQEEEIRLHHNNKHINDGKMQRARLLLITGMAILMATTITPIIFSTNPILPSPTFSYLAVKNLALIMSFFTANLLIQTSLMASFFSLNHYLAKANVPKPTKALNLANSTLQT